MTITKILATGFGLGYVPKMPGTAGSVLGLALVWWLTPLGMATYTGIAVLFIFFAVWVSHRAEREFAVKDAPQIVIDEIAGILVTFIAVPVLWPTLVAGFFLFRFFDIVKPTPIKQTQRLPGGWGVVMDDVAAGVVSNIVLQIVLTMWYVMAT